MNNYKINIIYKEENNINDIFIKVLNKELKKYIETSYKKEIPKLDTKLSCKDKENKS